MTAVCWAGKRSYVAGIDKGETFGIGIKGFDDRSGHFKGEGTVYYPITSSSCQNIKDVRVGEKEECI
jgi:hypothetical protein